MLLGGLTLLRSCARVPYVVNANQALNEPADLQTSSKLTRRDKPGSPTAIGSTSEIGRAHV